MKPNTNADQLANLAMLIDGLRLQIETTQARLETWLSSQTDDGVKQMATRASLAMKDSYTCLGDARKDLDQLREKYGHQIV
jgi:hypothetical protein